MTEQELRSLLQKSKKEGHRAVFQQYGNYVYAIVYSKLRSCATHEDIEECVSDVFAEIFMHLDTDHEGSLQGYIGIVAKRTAINAYHRLSGKSCMMISLDDENLPPIRTEEDVAQDYENKTMRALLLDKIKALGEPDSSIIIQKYFYRRNSGQIAKMLSLSPATVRKRCERAIKKLKSTLSEEDFYETESKSG